MPPKVAAVKSLLVTVYVRLRRSEKARTSWRCRPLITRHRPGRVLQSIRMLARCPMRGLFGDHGTFLPISTAVLACLL